jgi:hypothetical protein
MTPPPERILSAIDMTQGEIARHERRRRICKTPGQRGFGRHTTSRIATPDTPPTAFPSSERGFDSPHPLSLGSWRNKGPTPGEIAVWCGVRAPWPCLTSRR